MEKTSASAQTNPIKETFDRYVPTIRLNYQNQY